MEMHEFTEQIDRLKSVYGERAYPDARVELLWRDINNLSNDWFIAIVSQLICSAKFAPLPSDFSEHISLERERIWKIKKDRQLINKTNICTCSFCSDNGTYLCTIKGNRSEPYAFRCHCQAGISDPRKHIPQYKQAHADQGFEFYEVDWVKNERMA